MESADGSSYCRSCGAPLLEPLSPGEERKTVSALFCDLTGFTGQAELLDPEDVRRLLDPYFKIVRGELERFGATVEKYIGDAIFALFGAPRAHEDDPERAVRAALAILDAVGDLGATEPGPDLHVQIGVTTGEALVDVGRAADGTGMAWGDVLNTASRLEEAAPVDGILVDERTYLATYRVIEYQAAEPVVAKGKSQPLLVWQAVAPLADRGLDLAEADRQPLIGRGEELGLLLDTLEQVCSSRSPQLVTLVGQPGIGKSRLAIELFRHIEQQPELITWRHGRSPPYGEGVTFWALGEIVKRQAGILETDGAAAAADKLRRAVHDVVRDHAEAARIEGHLDTLIGLGGTVQTLGDQGAAFAAWRHFLEALARVRPLVLVFEDLHWADDGLLDFIEDLARWAEDIPLFVLATARPELLDRRPEWGEAKNTTTLVLSPLSKDETHELVSSLTADALPAETDEAVVARASGNPLYAVEFVRMLADRGLLVRAGAGGHAAETLPVPESLRSIVAARLDSLSAEEKAALQTAAVVGKAVWPAALAAVGRQSRHAVARHLEVLERKEYLTRTRRSSVEGEPEYRFQHVFVRDVAYAQIPRRRRGEIHRRTAEWLESLSPDRAVDRAEMLAHHYQAAYALMLAAGAGAEEIAERARLASRDAGGRALGLNAFSAAARFYRAALDLWPEADAERPQLLLRLGKALYYAEIEGAEVLAEAEKRLLETGDPDSAAEAATLLAGRAHQRGESQEHVFEHANRALSLVADREASRVKLEVLLDLAHVLGLVAEHARAIELATEALHEAETLELEELQARALAVMGMSRGLSGDQRGRADLERSIAIAEEIDSPLASHHCGMLADLESTLGNLNECFVLQARARRYAERFGHEAHIQWFKAEQVAEGYWTGHWDEALRLAAEFVAEAEAGPGHFMEAYCRDIRGRIRLARGDITGAFEDAEAALRQARASNEPQMLYPALAFSARTFAASDGLDQAARFADELLALWRSRLNDYPASSWVVDLMSALEPLDRRAALVEIAGTVTAKTAWLDAVSAFARGDFRTAIALFGQIGSLPDEALARLRAAQALAADGQEVAARAECEESLVFFRRVDANAFVSEAEALATGPGTVVTKVPSP